MEEPVANNKRFAWLIIGVAVLMGITIIVQRNMDYGSHDDSKSMARQINEKNFSKHTRKGVVLVDYWATWCKPCIAMEPLLEEIAIEYEGRARLCKVDIDNNRNLTKEFKINLIPTLIVMIDGKEVHRFTGVQEKDTITMVLDELLKNKIKQ